MSLIQLMIYLEGRGLSPYHYTVAELELYYSLSRSDATRFLAAWRLLQQGASHVRHTHVH